eukprot:202317_1
MCLELRNERNSKLLVNHKGKDSHHCSTSLVKLNSTLLKLGLLIKSIPSVVKCSVTEVSYELSSSDVLHYESLKESNESKKLEKSGIRDLGKSGESSWDVSEGGSVLGDGSWKTNSGLLNKVSYNSKHGNTSVLNLNKSETVEFCLVSVLNKSERIEESKGLLDSKLTLESAEGSGSLCNLGRSEGGSRDSKGGGDDKLHFSFDRLNL